MIAFCGIAILVGILALTFFEWLREKFGVHSDIPTQAELDALPNKLNELHIKRTNKK